MLKTILLLATTIAGLLTLLTINKLDKRTKEGSATTVDTIPPLVASTITLVLYLVYDVTMLVADDNLGKNAPESILGRFYRVEVQLGGESPFSPAEGR